jgi:hypothetical protein
MATEHEIQKKKDRIERAQAKLSGGGAPVVTQENYRVRLQIALCYYNANMENKERVKTVLNHLRKNNKPYFDVLSEAPDYEFLTLGSLLTIRNNGEYLSPEDSSRIESKLDVLYEKYKAIQAKKALEPVDDTAPKTPVISVEQRVIESARKHSEDIDYAIDAFFKTRKADFSTKAFLGSNGISGAVAKRIGEYYKSTLAEIEEAMEGKDEQLVEGYSFLTKAELKRFRDFIASIIEDCTNASLAAKANRAPRVKKAKPAAVQVAKMKYLNEFVDLGLKSIHPTKIVGAQQLWIYNTKNKKLGVYYATGASGFSVKGTSLLGWDPETSSQNSLRKPADTIPKVLEAGKIALNKILPGLTTINTKMNGRINAETILLRVL